MRLRRDPLRLLSRQLVRVETELVQAREDLAVAEEQYLVFDSDADDTEVRMVLDETVHSARQHRDSVRHVELMTRQIERLRERVRELEQAQSAILRGLGR